VSEHTDALNAMDGIPASVGFCEPVEGYRYRPNDAVRSITEMACEITHIRQQLNQKQADLDRALARVAELEEGLAGIENCAFGYQGCRQTAEEAADWMNAEATRLLEGTNGAHTLRKQAEVLERLMDGVGVHTHETVTGEGISTDEIWDYAQSLRQQADQLEKAGGEE